MSLCVELAASAVQASAASPCTGYVLLTVSEADLVLSSPFRLTAEQGASIGVAIGAVWALAWGIRVLLRLLQPDAREDEGI